MKYISTRDASRKYSFRETVMAGLARDGGLFLPAGIPDVSGRLEEWAKLSYQELAFEIMRLYTDFEAETLRALIEKSYSSFRHSEITPVVQVGGLHVMELFHGPTLAFKDVALQFLGNLFELFLEDGKQRLNIVAATSGDTGSAAIYGVRGKKGLRIFVMFPKGRISPTQELQMTSVMDSNVFNIAVKGSFDDCQNMLKAIFRDLDFKDKFSLGSVNSINWARILAQIVYYFYGAFRVMAQTGTDSVRFSVPTGNFGDIFAGFMAQKMGLPIKKLVLATNENDILARFFQTGVYSSGEVQSTLSPSMDIQVASNFERYLYYSMDQNTGIVRELMESFAQNGVIKVAFPADGVVDPLFTAVASDTATTLEVIRRFYEQHDYILDPHTAVGVGAAEKFPDEETPVICLATAHPAKFSEAIEKAVGKNVARHEILDKLSGLPVRCETCENSIEAVREIISREAGRDI